MKRAFLLPHRSSRFAMLARLLIGLLLPAVMFGGWAVFAVGLSAPAQATLLLAGVTAQTLLCWLLLSVWFERRLAQPARDMAHLANELAAGRMDRPLGWHGGDELGRLAACLEQARQTMQRASAEQKALLDRLPSGVLLVRNRVIESVNRRAEVLLAYAPGQLVGCVTEIIYPAKEDFLDVGARAYALVEQGQVFSEKLWLIKHDGEHFQAVLGGCALDPEKPQDGSVWTITSLARRGDHSNRLEDA